MIAGFWIYGGDNRIGSDKRIIERGYRNAGIDELSIGSGNEAPRQTDESALDGRRGFVKNHLGINANVHIEPPAGTFVAA
jgi:hypothetical protein